MFVNCDLKIESQIEAWIWRIVTPLVISVVDCLVCRCSILACSAFVALALGDNLMALNHAEKLLHQTKVSGSLK